MNNKLGCGDSLARFTVQLLLTAMLGGCGGGSDTAPGTDATPPTTTATPPLTPTPRPTPTPTPSPPTPTPSPAPTPGPSSGLLFLDEFEYTVTRTDANVSDLFRAHGWSGAKSMQSAPGANGYLYTANGVPGSSVQNPGRNSARVLVIESLAQQRGGQTDFYLQYGVGEEASYDNFIPGNVWIQFWICPLRAGSQLTGFHNREKFI